jgi:hypothetical protein
MVYCVHSLIHLIIVIVLDWHEGAFGGKVEMAQLGTGEGAGATVWPSFFLEPKRR